MYDFHLVVCSTLADIIFAIFAISLFSPSSRTIFSFTQLSSPFHFLNFQIIPTLLFFLLTLLLFVIHSSILFVFIREVQCHHLISYRFDVTFVVVIIFIFRVSSSLASTLSCSIFLTIFIFFAAINVLFL